MALIVGNQTSANSMTIAWGSFGFLWNRQIHALRLLQGEYFFAGVKGP